MNIYVTCLLLSPKAFCNKALHKKIKQTWYQRRPTYFRLSFVIHDGRWWLFSAQRASLKLQTYHLL